MPSKKSYFVLAIGMSLIWEIIKKSKGNFARVIHKIFCLDAIFAREGKTFEKNELVHYFFIIMKPVSMAKLI